MNSIPIKNLLTVVVCLPLFPTICSGLSSGTISGRVVLEDNNQPAAGLKLALTLRIPTTTWPSSIELTTTTNNQGVYVFSDLGVGEFELTLVSEGGWFPSLGIEGHPELAVKNPTKMGHLWSKEGHLKEGENIRVEDIMLEYAGAIQGRVFDEAGTPRSSHWPKPGAEILLANRTDVLPQLVWSVKEEGKYFIGGLKVREPLLVIAVCPAPEEPYNEHAPPSAIGYATNVILKAGTTVHADIICKPIDRSTISIKGNILNREGRPVALVYVADFKIPVVRMSSINEQGNFTIHDLPPGKYTLGISDLSKTVHKRQVKLSSTQPKVINIRIKE